MHALQRIKAIASRELYGYLGSPVAYVFIVFFLALSGFFTFMLGSFFERNEASLEAFFLWHPWLYMFLVPAIGMRMWAEERRSGTLELLFTMPINQWDAIVGKFVAAGLLLTISLALTFPMAITVEQLGNPDMGVILCGYVGSLFVALAFLAVSALTSSLTRNQVVSFIFSWVICLLSILAGWPPVTNLFRHGWAVPLLANFVVCYAITWLIVGLLFMAAKGLVGKLAESLTAWGAALLVSLISAAVCLGLMKLGANPTGELFSQGTPPWIVDLVASFSITPHFDRIRIGIIDSRSVVFFLSIILFCLFTTGVVLQNRRAN